MKRFGSSGLNKPLPRRVPTYESPLSAMGQPALLVASVSAVQRKRGRRTKPAPDGPRQGAQQNRTWPTPPSGGVAASSASAEYKNPKVQVGGFVWKQFLTHTRQFKLSAGLRSAARIRKFLLFNTTSHTAGPSAQPPDTASVYQTPKASQLGKRPGQLAAFLSSTVPPCWRDDRVPASQERPNWAGCQNTCQ